MAVHTSREVDSFFEDLAVHADTSGQANSSQGLTGHSERKLFMKTVENTSLAQAFSENNQRLFLHIVFASTSGHAEYVVEALIEVLSALAPGRQIAATIAEKTQPEDLLRGDALVLASSTWNTGSVEGQLNPHMWVLLKEKAKNLDLAVNRAHASDSGMIDIFIRLEPQIFCSPTLRGTMCPGSRSDGSGNWKDTRDTHSGSCCLRHPV
jgi:flavodoxin